MNVMPANSTGWMWVALARETGRIGHLYSPGAQRGPWEWFPYACDNGCFSLWNPQDNSFDESAWLSTGQDAWARLMFWCQSAPIKPRWAIVPDRPGDWNATLEKWQQYATQTPFPLAVAVQDGADVAAVKAMRPTPEVVCVGGSTEWKWNTVEMWAENFPRVHVLRCNSPEKLYYLESLGVESCDGTGWNRGDRKQTRGIEEWARTKATPIITPLWPHASRAQKDKKQEIFA